MKFVRSKHGVAVTRTVKFVHNGHYRSVTCIIKFVHYSVSSTWETRSVRGNLRATLFALYRAIKKASPMIMMRLIQLIVQATRLQHFFLHQ